MSFTTDEECMSALADMLKQSVEDVTSPYGGMVPRCRVNAYQEIQGRLLRRGFLLEQITGWDRGVEYELDVMLGFVLLRTGALEGADWTGMKMLLARKEEIDTVQVFVNGVHITPGTGTAGPGTVGSGGPAPSTPGSFPSSPRDMRF